MSSKRKWRFPLNKVAATQGWLLTVNGTSGRMKIKAYPFTNDEEGLYGRFDNDADAEEFVRQQAAASDETAMKAIELLVKQVMDAPNEFFK